MDPHAVENAIIAWEQVSSMDNILEDLRVQQGGQPAEWQIGQRKGRVYEADLIFLRTANDDRAFYAVSLDKNLLGGSLTVITQNLKGQGFSMGPIILGVILACAMRRIQTRSGANTQNQLDVEPIVRLKPNHDKIVRAAYHAVAQAMGWERCAPKESLYVLYQNFIKKKPGTPAAKKAKIELQQCLIEGVQNLLNNKNSDAYVVARTAALNLYSGYRFFTMMMSLASNTLYNNGDFTTAIEVQDLDSKATLATILANVEEKKEEDTKSVDFDIPEDLVGPIDSSLQPPLPESPGGYSINSHSAPRTPADYSEGSHENPQIEAKKKKSKKRKAPAPATPNSGITAIVNRNAGGRNPFNQNIFNFRQSRFNDRGSVNSGVGYTRAAMVVAINLEREQANLPQLTEAEMVAQGLLPPSLGGANPPSPAEPAPQPATPGTPATLPWVPTGNTPPVPAEPPVGGGGGGGGPPDGGDDGGSRDGKDEKKEGKYSDEDDKARELDQNLLTDIQQIVCSKNPAITAIQRLLGCPDELEAPPTPTETSIVKAKKANEAVMNRMYNNN